MSKRTKKSLVAGVLMVIGVDLVLLFYYLSLHSNFFTGIFTGEFVFEPLMATHVYQAIVVNLLAFAAGFFFRFRMSNPG